MIGLGWFLLVVAVAQHWAPWTKVALALWLYWQSHEPRRGGH